MFYSCFPCLFSSPCLRSADCRAISASKTKPSDRPGHLSLHHISWGEPRQMYLRSAQDGFFAAVVWGEHTAATLEPDPWQDPTFSQIARLATVFGCESFSVGEDDPTTAWNTLQAWWQERDPQMPFGSKTPHPAPVGLL